MSTIDATAADQALRRFTSCVLQSGVDLQYRAIRHVIAECLQLLVHLERCWGQRVVTELVRRTRPARCKRYVPAGIAPRLAPVSEVMERRG